MAEKFGHWFLKLKSSCTQDLFEENCFFFWKKSRLWKIFSVFERKIVRLLAKKFFNSIIFKTLYVSSGAVWGFSWKIQLFFYYCWIWCFLGGGQKFILLVKKKHFDKKFSLENFRTQKIFFKVRGKSQTTCKKIQTGWSKLHSKRFYMSRGTLYSKNEVFGFWAKQCRSIFNKLSAWLIKLLLMETTRFLWGKRSFWNNLIFLIFLTLWVEVPFFDRSLCQGSDICILRVQRIAFLDIDLPWKLQIL